LWTGCSKSRVLSETGSSKKNRRKYDLYVDKPKMS
jgi:hypothetical protein